ncbi:unnamed protein product [Allacma fusca]|uniref:Uncharacterized protein n=1 Tax=Allacma fusca TaxID=39272 RepID=A0A8J2LBY4_9HEXA|nr:unnamed protein product [Allacma fusca]
MDDLLRKRRNLKRKLTRAKNKIDTHISQPLDADDTEILSDQLKEIWIEFNELSDEIMITCEEAEMEAQEEAFNEISDKYYEGNHTLKVIIRKIVIGEAPYIDGGNVGGEVVRLQPQW